MEEVKVYIWTLFLAKTTKARKYKWSYCVTGNVDAYFVNNSFNFLQKKLLLNYGENLSGRELW